MPESQSPSAAGASSSPTSPTSRAPGHHDVPQDSSEQTPLLSSASSETLNDDSYTSFPTANGRPRSASSGSAIDSSSKIGKLRVLALIANAGLLLFLQTSNAAGITVIQGALAEDLDAHETAIWFTACFWIATSCTAPLAGKLCTVISTRYVLLPATFLIAIGSVVCALSEAFTPFIVGRVLAGLGAGGSLTLVMIMILELTSPEQRGFFIGLANAGVTLGVSFGAVVYGALLPAVGWRALFGIQAPLALIAGFGLFFTMPTLTSQQDRSAPEGESVSTRTKLARIDYGGAFLLSFTITSLLYGLTNEIQLWPLFAALVGLVVFVTFESTVARDPVIPLQVLRSRAVLFACLSQLILMSSRWVILFYTPVYMLSVRGVSPAAAGSVLIPTNVGFGLGGLLAGVFHIRRNGSFWLPPLVCVAVFSTTTYALSFMASPNSSVVGFAALVVANGLGTGAAMNYTIAHLLHVSHKDTQYITTSLMGTFRGFGGSFGTSVAGGVFYRILKKALTGGYLALDGGHTLSPSRQRLVSRLLGNPDLVYHGGLSPDAHQVAMDSFAGALGGLWQGAAATAIIALLLQAGTGWKAPAAPGNSDIERARAVAEENEGPVEA